MSSKILEKLLHLVGDLFELTIHYLVFNQTNTFQKLETTTTSTTTTTSQGICHAYLDEQRYHGPWLSMMGKGTIRSKNPTL
jgi:hypothetical protein